MDKQLIKYWLVLYKYDKDPLQRISLLRKIVAYYKEQQEPIPSMMKEFIEKEKQRLQNILQKQYQEKVQEFQAQQTSNTSYHHHDPWENENDPFSH